MYVYFIHYNFFTVVAIFKVNLVQHVDHHIQFLILLQDVLSCVHIMLSVIALLRYLYDFISYQKFQVDRGQYSAIVSN